MSNNAVKARRKNYVWLGLLCLAVWGMVACQNSPPILKIGLVAPFEGQHRAIGYDVIYSARLAIREINQANGIGGYRLALVAVDDGGTPELAAQAAASLVLDPQVVVVVGHWLTPTTALVEGIYEEAGLPLVPMGEPPLGMFVPAQLPASFQEKYAAITPFEEQAGVYAGTTYDAFQLIFAAMAENAGTQQTITRANLAQLLPQMQQQGITGVVFVP